MGRSFEKIVPFKAFVSVLMKIDRAVQNPQMGRIIPTSLPGYSSMDNPNH